MISQAGIACISITTLYWLIAVASYYKFQVAIFCLDLLVSRIRWKDLTIHVSTFLDDSGVSGIRKCSQCLCQRDQEYLPSQVKGGSKLHSWSRVKAIFAGQKFDQG